jgi:energy-coupling factor transporter ATP-binding protein EcfA2
MPTLPKSGLELRERRGQSQKVIDAACFATDPDVCEVRVCRLSDRAVENLAIEFRTRGGTVRAVDAIGFELRRGETMALVGESGSGKSVTAYAIMGILDAAARITSGRIVFGGLELLQAGDKAIADKTELTEGGDNLCRLHQIVVVNELCQPGKHCAEHDCHQAAGQAIGQADAGHPAHQHDRQRQHEQPGIFEMKAIEMPAASR